MKAPAGRALPFARGAAHAILAAALSGASATGLGAQFPAEVRGHVLEAGSSAPIEDARVEVGAGAAARTDASGSFAVRSADAGHVVLRVSRSGYASLERIVVLESGRVTLVTFALEPAPIEIDALEVVATPRPEGVHVLTRSDIEDSDARTLGELIRTMPGVVVNGSGTGERVSIRGSGADAVLVLLDGAPVNDPITGEADLSLVSPGDVETVRVIPGAQTARYGPRAEGGVIVIESRRSRDARVAASALAGDYGERSLAADAAFEAGPIGVSFGSRYARRDDEFSYARPEALGGGSAARMNAAERTLSASAGVERDAGGDAIRFRIEAIDLDRGLPGPMHAPTPEARQDFSRASVVGGWTSAQGRFALRVDASASWQRVRFEDPSPAFGAPYSDTTHVREAGLGAEVEHVTGAAFERTMTAGFDLRATRLRSSALEPRVVERTDPALFARAGVVAAALPLTPALRLALRADEWAGDWIASHDVTFGIELGLVALTVSQRSAFSPPSASDQFFRGGFAIAPNPELEPERVPSEVELGANAALTVARLPLRFGASAFRGDVDGMIAWAPDFRFVWSPRNHDVHRSGGEIWLQATPRPSLELSAHASVARVTYDFPGDADTAQLVYRPRHSGGATLDWRTGAWRLSLDALYTGVRQATPGGSNPLDGYWNIDAALAREWRVGTLDFTTTLAADRLNDNHDPFVHGYPEPGRRLRFELRAAPRAFTNPSPGLDR